MKHILTTTIVAVLLVGYGKVSNPEADRALIHAAKDGNIEAVKQHLAAGADVNAKGKDGNTLLHYAIRGGLMMGSFTLDCFIAKRISLV